MSIASRAPNRLGKPAGKTAPDNQLSFTDQAMFLGLRATGQESVMQGVWIYEHPVDLDGVRRFHRVFGQGLYGRLIERSPLPFGRHRWVSALGPAAPLDIAESARPRAELSDWVDERARLPIDPQWGPGWHLGVQPFADGSTVVCLTGSHCLGDGSGALLTIADAVMGTARDFGYPPARSRTRRSALVADAAQTVRAIPEVARTLGTAVTQAVRRRHDIARSGATQGATSADDSSVVLPAATLFVDAEDWVAYAASHGGTSYALSAAFAIRLAERMGRRRAEDGAVTLIIPISERGLDDSRANAVSLGSLTLDPTSVATELSGVRAALRQAITTAREEPDESLRLLPLIPFIPKRAVKRGADVMFGFADLPVSCSTMGDLPPMIAQIDGTAAEYVFMRGVDRYVPRQVLEQRRGLLTVVSGRIGDKVSIDVVAYHLGAANSKAALRELMAGTVAEFGLSGTII